MEQGEDEYLALALQVKPGHLGFPVRMPRCTVR